MCHYIHLNAVRAKIVSAAQLEEFRWSSLHWLSQPRKRPPALCLETAFSEAGSLADTPAGRICYLAYLDWLATDTAEQKARNFEKMSRGWLQGTQGFMAAQVQDQKEVRRIGQASEADSVEARQLAWEAIVVRCLKAWARRIPILPRRKRRPRGKFALATHLKLTTTASNPWNARRLHIGDLNGVSRYCTECRSGQRPEARMLQGKITDIRV